jgi:pimeloyl-ACP methyl ester carboxylesterase
MPTHDHSPTLPRLIGAGLNGLAAISPYLAGHIAFDLFGKPRPRKPKPEELQFLATADLHYEMINGRKVALYHWGFRGPVVLLVHGWESHAGRWRKLASPLVQAGFQVLAPDAPAHGRTDGRRFTMVHYAGILQSLMKRFGPMHAVVAHSVGGAASIWAMGNMEPSLRPQKAVILAAFSELELVINNARQLFGASPKLSQAFDRYVENRFGHPPSYFSPAKASTQLGDVAGLLIHDRNDKVTPFDESLALERHWPGVQLIATEGLGHGLTAPAVWEMILDFVTTESYICRSNSRSEAST